MILAIRVHINVLLNLKTKSIFSNNVCSFSTLKSLHKVLSWCIYFHLIARKCFLGDRVLATKQFLNIYNQTVS